MSIPHPHMPVAGWPGRLPGPEFPPGLVWLVGAGPGDPGLMTLHGLNALAQADVVVHDALVDPAILEWRRPGAAVENAGKRGGRPSPSQACISGRLIAHARAGLRVLRLKGGDPFVFGRGGEEAQTLLRAGVPVRVTPGVTAGIGGLAYAGIPVTHRDVNQAVTFVTGHDASGAVPDTVDWAAIARGSPVIVLYMAMRHLTRIAGLLTGAGRAADEPVAIVQNAARADMKVLETTLGDVGAAVEGSGIGAPAVVCVGPVVNLRPLADWVPEIAARPLAGAEPR